jgi:uncharacterized repeat protein (TIGR03943 family)
MRKDAQAVLLLLVGGTLLKISVTGTYVRYVKPSSRWLLIVAGLALLGVAAATLWRVLRDQVSAGRPVPAPVTKDPGATLDDTDDRHGDHESFHGADEHSQSRIGWLLMVPALALLVLAPPSIGSFQASRSGTALTAPADSDFAPLPDGDPVRISVLDYASRAVFDHGKSLAGRRVTLSGFVMAGPNGAPYLARMIVTCCAADARPIKVGLTGAVPGGLRPDAWIEVDGTFTERTDQDPVNKEVIPYLEVSAVRNIPAPEAQYES